MTYNILLVEDDSAQVHLLKHMIQDKWKYQTTVVTNGQDAINYLSSDAGSKIDLVLLDLMMPGGVDGFQVLNEIKPLHPDLPVIVRTGHDDIDMAVQAMKAGATDFLNKKDENDRLQASIVNALRVHVLHDELSRLKRSMKGQTSFDEVIGRSKPVEEMIELAQKVAASNIPVLLEGESGVGKELLARAIHNASDRADKPFIAVNCGAIPANLVESILFGHEKGAFTGALYKTVGKFREADGGTLFLDEIGELEPDLQVKLLRVLQEGEIEPVGSSKNVKVDIRLLSATNRNLGAEVSDGRFREDLYYRLNVFPIYIPTLQERYEDIPMMIKHFYTRFSASEEKNIKGISDEALDLLSKYRWPGNIRQLKNAIFRAVVLCEGEILDVNDFPQLLKDIARQPEQVLGGNQDQSAEMSEPIMASANILSLLQEAGDFKPMQDLEQEIIKAAITHYQGCMSKVARKLGIGRSTLYRKLEDMGVDPRENLPQ